MKPGDSMLHSQGLSNNPYPEPNQPNSPILIYISSRPIVILSSQLRRCLPKRYLSCKCTCESFEITPTFFHSGPIFFHSGYMPFPSQSSRFNHPNYIRWTVQTMKFLLFEPFPLSILIPLRPKYSPQDPAFKYP